MIAWKTKNLIAYFFFLNFLNAKSILKNLKASNLYMSKSFALTLQPNQVSAPKSPPHDIIICSKNTNKKFLMTKPRCIVFGSGSQRACNRLQLRWHARKGRHLNATPLRTLTHTDTFALACHELATMFFWLQASAVFVRFMCVCVCVCVCVVGALVQVNKCKLTPTANGWGGGEEGDVDRKKFGCWHSWRTDWLCAYMPECVWANMKTSKQISVAQRSSNKRGWRGARKRSRTKYCCFADKISSFAFEFICGQ